MAKKKETLSFEEAMAQLETIVSQLERADIPLEEALQQFQKGIELSQYCKTTLDNAKKTVTTLINDDNTTTEIKPIN